MVEVPDSLRSVFNAAVQEQNGTYVLEVPSGELEHEALTRGETYRVAILDTPATTGRSTQPAERADETGTPLRPRQRGSFCRRIRETAATSNTGPPSSGLG